MKALGADDVVLRDQGGLASLGKGAIHLVVDNVARAFPLSDIVAAQTKFSRKEFVGNFVLIPPDL